MSITIYVQRLLSIWIYSLLHYIPHVLILVFPFRNRLRFPNNVTFAVILMGYVLQVHIEALSLYGVHHGLQTLISVIISFALAVICIRDLPSKILTQILTITSVHSSIMIFYHYIMLAIFPDHYNDRYHWTGLIITAILCLIVVLIILPFSKKYRDAVNRDSVTIVWSYMWILPLTALMVWTFYFSTSQQYNSGEMEKPAVIFLLLMLNIAFLSIYFVMLSLVEIFDERQKLIRMERQHQKQFSALQHQIEYARYSRHDLRHHLAVINQFVASKDYNHLESYLKEYTASVQDDHKLTYCKHYSVNSLLVHFSTQCRYNQIAFQAECLIPENITIPTSDLIIILGNLLENAYKACQQVKSHEPFIEVKAITDENSFILSVVNTTDQLPRTNEKGQFLSTSHSGIGIGTDSVRSVVSKYNGTVDFSIVDHKFSVDLIMDIPKKKVTDLDQEVSND